MLLLFSAQYCCEVELCNQTPADPISHNDTRRFYTIKSLAKIKLIIKTIQLISEW